LLLISIPFVFTTDSALRPSARSFDCAVLASLVTASLRMTEGLALALVHSAFPWLPLDRIFGAALVLVHSRRDVNAAPSLSVYCLVTS
jgi:hypothetical protein